MAIFNDIANDFDFAYKGFQYPLPPTWKRAIRLEDQIQWLLQAILKTVAEGTSVDELNKAIADASAKLSESFAELDERTRLELVAQINALAQAVDQIEMGAPRFRDIIDGLQAHPYTATRHAHDCLLLFGMTYAEAQEIHDYATLDGNDATNLRLHVYALKVCDEIAPEVSAAVDRWEDGTRRDPIYSERIDERARAGAYGSTIGPGDVLNFARTYGPMKTGVAVQKLD